MKISFNGKNHSWARAKDSRQKMSWLALYFNYLARQRSETTNAELFQKILKFNAVKRETCQWFLLTSARFFWDCIADTIALGFELHPLIDPILASPGLPQTKLRIREHTLDNRLLKPKIWKWKQRLSRSKYFSFMLKPTLVPLRCLFSRLPEGNEVLGLALRTIEERTSPTLTGSDCWGFLTRLPNYDEAHIRSEFYQHLKPKW